MDWLLWAPLGAASLHICEEFLLPGGFPAWYRAYRADPSHITPRFLMVINGALLLACCNIALVGRVPVAVAAWLALTALMAANGLWHVWAAWKTRTYSPGMVTGVLVYVPLAIYGYISFVRTGAASIATAVGALVIGGSYQIWSAVYHGRAHDKPSRL